MESGTYYYEKFSKETLLKLIEDISLPPTDAKKLVVYMVDKRDGILKDYTETQQFEEYLRTCRNS